MAVEQVVNLPFLYVYGCQLSTTTDSTLLVTSGQLRNDTNIIDMVASSNLTINSGVVGANGLDTGEIDTEKWYCVFIIGDQYGFHDAAAIISLSQTNPLMPTGYNIKRRIGWIRTDGSANFVSCYYAGISNEREYFWNVETADAIVLSGGSATTYTGVNCSTLVPPSARSALFLYDFMPHNDTHQFFVRVTNSGITENFYISGNVADKHIGGQFYYPTSSGVTRSIDYKVTTSNDELSLFVNGYKDYI